jgi:hypothetical protein
MSSPECIRPQRRSYGALVGLSLDQSFMLATFLQDGVTVTWECPETELYSLLARHLTSAAKARLCGANDRQLRIWKHATYGWQVSAT